MNQDEWSLLRALCRYGLQLDEAEKVHNACDPTKAGTGLLEIATQEGLGPFLLWALEECKLELPTPYRQQLGEIADSQRDHLVRVHIATAEALRLLRSWDIPALVAKGMAVNRHWPRPLLRTMSDVDILVPFEKRHQLWDNYAAIRERQNALRVTTEIEPNHHDITVSHTVPFSFADLMNNASSARVAGEESRVTSPTDALLITAAAGLRKDIRSLRLVLDTAFLLQTGQIDLADTWELARKLHLDGSLFLLLAQLHHHFGIGAKPTRPNSLKTKLALGLLGLNRNQGAPSFTGSSLSRWSLRLLVQPFWGSIKRLVGDLFPRPIALRNRYGKQGMRNAPVTSLYLHHWRCYLEKLWR